MPFSIAGRRIAPGAPAFIIAELSANHGQDLEQAKRLVQAAKTAGADAVKLQTYTPDTMTIDCDAPPFRIRGTVWDGRNLYSLYQEAHTPWEWHPVLKQTAENLGLAFFSTPFDATAVDFLEELGVPAYKIASFEVVDIPLLEYVARTGKPVIMSTGMASPREIDEALATLRASGSDEIALLHCISAYPSPAEAMHLGAISELRAAYGPIVGLSDHSLGHEAVIASVALGAVIVEKHLTLSREHPGPDSTFSLEPDEFAAMVQAVRRTETAIRGGLERPPLESASRAFRRSLFVVRDVRRGEPFSTENLRSIRPADGMHPRYFKEVLGKRAACDITRGTPLDAKHVMHFEPTGCTS